MEIQPDPPPPRPLLSVASVLAGVAPAEPPAIHVRYFTDPLSAWCWGTEPAWLHLVELYGPQFALELRMAGLYQSLEEVTASASAFHRPDQIAMQWEEVAHLTGMPLDSEVWLKAPPASSWPACAAVKAAEAQDPAMALVFLRRLREAALCERADVADPEVLSRLASAVGLDVARFDGDLESGAAGEAFNEDLVLAAEIGAVSTPAFFFFGPGGVAEVRGARSFEDLEAALAQVAGGALSLDADPQGLPDRQAYVRALTEARGSVTAPEIAELLGLDRGDAADLLDRMSAAGALARAGVEGGGALYRAPAADPAT